MAGMGLGALLCACGSAPPQPENARLAQAADSNRRGEAALRQGDYRKAQALYEAALRADLSVEHVEGIAINSINLARVYQLLGAPELAHRQLDAILLDTVTPFPGEYVAAARLRKAMLYQAAGDTAGAEEWAAKAGDICKDGACAWYGTLLNLRARFALAGGNTGAALDFATQALAANRGRGAREETANSLRLQAEARIQQKEFSAALAPLVEALSLDKALGLPERIELDLRQLAAAYDGTGNADQAREFRTRAGRIAEQELPVK